MTSKSSPSSPSPPSSAILWDVQDILAERRTLNGNSEVLVVWKPSWIPKENIADGQIWLNFEQAPKCQFTSAIGKIILPVDQGSSLSEDIEFVAKHAEKQISTYRADYAHASSDSAPSRVAGSPRKTLGGEAAQAPCSKIPRCQ